MKKLYVFIYSAIVLSIVGTAILLVFSPETVPLHYNLKGEADRFGNKYEYFIIPLFNSLLGAFFMLYAKKQGKKGEPVNERILLYAGICTTLFFSALGFFFILIAINYSPDAAAAVNVDILKFVSIAIGILFVLIGNIMPKMRRNSLFGLRTKWSMANDSVWQKSQRFAGISSVVCGLVLIIAAPFISFIRNLLLMTAVPVVWLILCVIASYRYYKSEFPNN